MNMPIANLRTHLQHERIGNGVQSGELTRAEAKELRSQQKDIRSAITEAKSDGTVTKEERQDIRKLQNEASKDIFQAKHDGDKRGTPRADAREARQHGRIAAGVEDGSLTRSEAFGMRSMQGAIHRAEARFKADGTVTAEERAKLEQLQDMASKEIYRARHNGATRC